MRRASKGSSEHAAALIQQQLPALARCVAHGDAAYGLSLAGVKLADGQLSGRFQLARYSGAKADRLELLSLSGELGRFEGPRYAGAKLTAVLDLGRDGVPDVLLTTNGHYGGGEDAWERTDVYAIRGKRADRLALPAPFDVRPPSIEAHGDYDGDGRAELVLESPFEVDVPCTLDGTAYGPRFLVHDTPAGLRVDDELALRFAEAECASVSEPLVVIAKEGEDPRIAARQTALALGCARLRQLPVTLLRSRIQQAIEAALADKQACTYDLARLLTLTDVRTPLQLAPQVPHCR